MHKKIKNRVAKRAERKLKREEGTIDEAVRSVNERHNIVEGKSPYAKRKPMNAHEKLVESLKIDVKIGLYSINEARRKLGEPELTAPEADKLLVLTTDLGWVTLGDNQPVRVNVGALLPKAFNGSVGQP